MNFTTSSKFLILLDSENDYSNSKAVQVCLKNFLLVIMISRNHCSFVILVNPFHMSRMHFTCQECLSGSYENNRSDTIAGIGETQAVTP
jgi:hypothetical protein